MSELLLFRKGSRRDGEDGEARENARSRLIFSFYSGLAVIFLLLSLFLTYTYTYASYLISHLRNLEEGLLDTNFPYSLRLAVMNATGRLRPPLPWTSPTTPISFSVSLLFLCILFSSSPYTAGSSRQLKEVTLYSHARQGETPRGKREAPVDKVTITRHACTSAGGRLNGQGERSRKPPRIS